MRQTIAEYLIKRINNSGVEDIFGVPGDYNFHLIEAVLNNSKTAWVGCCNELNAGYATDGYARIKGMGALITTFGVGELSAVNAVAGSYAESVPIIKIVGLPNKRAKDGNKILHHCMGSADYSVFYDIYSKVTAYSVILSKENAQEEIEEALSVAYHQKKPVYIGVYNDFCTLPIEITTKEFEIKKSDEKSLNAAVNHILEMVCRAKNPVIIGDSCILRYKLQDEFNEFIKKSGFAATTLPMGKSSVDETLENYIGLYCGTILHEEVGNFVEKSDCVLGFGLLMTDFNSGAYTAKINCDSFIDIHPDFVKIQDKTYKNVYIKDVLESLTEKIKPQKMNFLSKNFHYKSQEATDENLSQNYIYSALQDFLSSGDIYISETGMTSFSSVGINLPKGVDYCNQVLWGSIGWGTPACFGAGIADRNRRVIMITGEGSHQMTAQEVSSMLRYGINPIIIVVNNGGYTVERLLCEDPMSEYNDIAKWDYTKFVEAFDGESLTIQARTKKEFYDALNTARRSESFVYIEAFTPVMDATDFVRKISSIVAPVKH